MSPLLLQNRESLGSLAVPKATLAHGQVHVSCLNSWLIPPDMDCVKTVFSHKCSYLDLCPLLRSLQEFSIEIPNSLSNLSEFDC